ncbi:MAG: 2-hydroxychromene-2-carboxylate isomerase [Alphaproteobacteria bacterium]|jgi:2-hydroxychromene-2-carboxylate isomerase
MPDIEYFYSAHSAYAYIGSALLSKIAANSGVRIIHRPMELRQVVAAMGGATNSLTPRRRAYFSGREIERWAAYRDAPIMRGMPTYHDNDIARSNGVLIAALEASHNIDQLAHQMLQAHWRDDADLDDDAALSKVIEAAGLSPSPLLEAALSPDIQKIHDHNTAEAIERSVFGSPTYFVDGDMFYGQDHLELVSQALEQPFPQLWDKR